MNKGPYSQLPLITPRTIRNAVVYDGQIRLWFRKLFCSPPALKHLKEMPVKGTHNYFLYRAVSLSATALLVISAGCCSAAEFIWPEHSLLLFVLAVGTAGGCISLLWTARRFLADLASFFVENNQIAALPGMTLYQLGEVYSRTYDVPSLVEIIGFWDHWLRRAFLAIYFALFGIYFFPFWKMIVWTMAGCYMVIEAVKVVVLVRRNLSPACQAGAWK